MRRPEFVDIPSLRWLPPPPRRVSVSIISEQIEMKQHSTGAHVGNLHEKQAIDSFFAPFSQARMPTRDLFADNYHQREDRCHPNDVKHRPE